MPPSTSGTRVFSNSRPQDCRSLPMEAVSDQRASCWQPLVKWEASPFRGRSSHTQEVLTRIAALRARQYSTDPNQWVVLL